MPANTRFFATSFASDLKVMRRIFADRSLRRNYRQLDNVGKHCSQVGELTFLVL